MQLSRACSPLLCGSSYGGGAEFRNRGIPYVGVKKFIEARLRGHAPATARYMSFLTGNIGQHVRLVYPRREDLGVDEAESDRNTTLAAHYGQSLEAEFTHMCSLRGARNFHDQPINPSPLARQVDQALEHLGMDVIGYQYLVTHGFPDHPVRMDDTERTVADRTFTVPGPPERKHTIFRNERYLVGAIDYVLLTRDRSRVVIADLKSTSDARLSSGALSLENVLQLHLYAYLFQRMTGVRVHHMLLIVENALYGAVRVHSLRFNAQALTTALYRDQGRTLMQDFHEGDAYAHRMAASVTFCASGAAVPEDVGEMVRGTGYIRTWLRRSVVEGGTAAFTLPSTWDLQDTESVAQWLVSLGFRRHQRALWKFVRPTPDQVSCLCRELQEHN